MLQTNQTWNNYGYPYRPSPNFIPNRDRVAFHVVKVLLLGALLTLVDMLPVLGLRSHKDDVLLAA